MWNLMQPGRQMPKLEFHHWQTYLRAEQPDERSQAWRLRRRSMEILHEGRIQQRYGGIKYLEDSNNGTWKLNVSSNFWNTATNINFQFLYRRSAPDEGRCAQSARDTRGRTPSSGNLWHCIQWRTFRLFSANYYYCVVKQLVQGFPLESTHSRAPFTKRQNRNLNTVFFVVVFLLRLVHLIITIIIIIIIIVIIICSIKTYRCKNLWHV